MVSSLIAKVEEKHLKKKPLEFAVGDTVDVHVKITEGDRHRIQIFNGVVIARSGKGLNENFMVRRIVNNEGVERIFPTHSPSIVKVEVKRSGVTRRAKLFYLRERTGKATRLREKWVGAKKK